MLQNKKEQFFMSRSLMKESKEANGNSYLFYLRFEK